MFHLQIVLMGFILGIISVQILLNVNCYFACNLSARNTNMKQGAEDGPVSVKLQKSFNESYYSTALWIIDWNICIGLHCQSS